MRRSVCASGEPEVAPPSAYSLRILEGKAATPGLASPGVAAMGRGKGPRKLRQMPDSLTSTND